MSYDRTKALGQPERVTTLQKPRLSQIYLEVLEAPGDSCDYQTDVKLSYASRLPPALSRTPSVFQPTFSRRPGQPSGRSTPNAF